ncbi:ankyrin repeat domain-containing protein [Corynebacterium halotolerans]|uniref:ankyrin repeat domain-containing protein n=1 Tax=Corynebacterium halotolerans TaxID=225326 RepID=UPI003CF343D8
MRSPVSSSSELIRYFDESRIEPLFLSCDLAALDTYLAGPGVDARGRHEETLLMRAADEHNLLVLSHLLSAGADPLLHDAAGRTALHHAALAGNDAAAELLIAAGAEVDARDNDGRTALWHAAALHLPDSAIVDVLLRSGAGGRLRDDRGVSPDDML